MLIKKGSLLGIVFLIFLTSSCTKDEQTSGTAQLMYVNGMTDITLSTVLISDSIYLALSAGFGNFSLYNQINSGSQQFKIRDNVLAKIIIEKSFGIAAGKNYTLLAVGNSGSRELVIKEDDLNIRDSTKASIRLINIVQNASAMSMQIDAGADLANNVSYKSFSEFTELLPSKYDLTIKSGNTVIANISGINLLPRKKYSILITGFVNQNPGVAYNIIVNR